MGGFLKQIKGAVKYYRFQFRTARRVFRDELFFDTYSLSRFEQSKYPSRTDIINYFSKYIQAETYLEIGVRNPRDNFDHVDIKKKYSVDPGIEYKKNPVDFKMTSDEFFSKKSKGQLTIPDKMKFDIIFVDGLHLANQTDTDIQNCLKVLKHDGVIILHDCNPPTIFHARENYNFRNSPARGYWSGTSWKAYYKFRYRKEIFSICFDSDWGVAVLSMKKIKGFNQLTGRMDNEFYEYEELAKDRTRLLNLWTFDDWKKNLRK